MDYIDWDAIAAIWVEAECSRLVRQPIEQRTTTVRIDGRLKKLELDKDLWLYTKTRDRGWTSEIARKNHTEKNGNVNEQVNRAIRDALNEELAYRAAVVIALKKLKERTV